MRAGRMRWVAWGLAVAGAVAAALGWSWRSAQTPPSSAATTTVAPLPLALPASRPEAAPAAPTTPALPTPALPRPAPGQATASAPGAIGSEGYGPHIDRAQAGADPQAAWEAVRWLRDCASNEARRGSFEQLRNQGVAPEFMTERMVELDAEARRCQTVTAAHRAMLPELATRAMRAGVPEAAAAYAGTVFAADLTAEQRREVADAMRRDAGSGHPASLLGAITSHAAWGLQDTERLAYLYAYVHLPGDAAARATGQALLRQGSFQIRANFTPEQLDTAKRQGEQILERVKAGRSP